jgi:serine protease Do
MASRSRDWVKFGTLLGVALVLGLVLTSVLNVPLRGGGAEASPALLQTTRPAPRQQPSRPIPAAKPAADLGDAFAAVAQHVQPTVVFVRAEREERASTRRLPPGFEEFFPQNRRPQRERGSGSGFIISADGYILTNNHVVADADRVTVRLFDKREFNARVVGRDAATDVAVIKIDATGLPTASFGDSDSTRIGEWVLAIGNPLGEAFTFTVTAGIVSAKGRLLRGLEQTAVYSIQDFIQTDAAINPGNSGGPLVDVHGDVIGINSAIASETGFYAGYGFAIPINLARAVTQQLIERGFVERAVMGVSIRDAGEEDAAAVGLDRIRGVVVQDFSYGDSPQDSPARKAGLQAGDVIVELDGEPVEYVAQLQQRVGFKKPGETVRITVLRGRGERRAFTVRLAAAPRDRTDVAARAQPGDEAGPAVEGVREERLGITVEPLTAELTGRSARLRELLAQGGGLVVTAVSADGPSYQRLFGTEDGGPDIITRVNERPVKSRADLVAALQAARPGDIVTLYVLTRAQDWQQRVVRVRLR